MFNINKAASITSKQFQPLSYQTPDDVLDWFENEGVKKVASKDKAEVIVFGKFMDQQKGRVKGNLVATRFVVVDIDKTNEVEMRRALKKLAPYYYFLHETHSSTEQNPRLRLIVFLDQPISGADYAELQLGSRLAVFAGIAEIDRVSDNSVQAYYVPSSPDDAEERAIDVNKGEKGCLPLQLLLEAELPKNKVAKAISQRGKCNDELKGTALIAEAKRVVQEGFAGYIINNNNRFWVYDDGIWGAVSDDEMVQHLLLEFYDSKQELSVVAAVIKYLKYMTLNTEFPTCMRENGAIVLESCAVDPITGKALKHNPKHYAKNKLSFDYDSEAVCPLWLEFLAQVFRDDKDQADKIALLQEFTGLSLTPITRFQKMLWLIGAGSNGKGVIFDIVRELIGSDNCSALPLADFKQRFALEQLEQKLANLDPEMSVSAVLADSKIKSVVGGDVISLERKMERVFQSRLYAKLWAAANSLPVTRDTSHGFFRRVLILTFNRVFLDSEQDKQLTNKLREELPGIFNWALAGLHRLLENDEFTVPESAVQELDEYKVNSNNVERFKREHLDELDASANVREGQQLGEIYPHYQVFCRANGMIPVNSSAFGQQLKALGIIKRQSNGKRYYPVKVKGMDIYQTDGFMPSPAPRSISIEEGFAVNG
ncbi:MAG: DNA primase family protein [Methylobacter sp.]